MSSRTVCHINIPITDPCLTIQAKVSTERTGLAGREDTGKWITIREGGRINMILLQAEALALVDALQEALTALNQEG